MTDIRTDSYPEHAPVDLIEAERQARALRAAALAEGLGAARRWIAGLFGGHGRHA